jgi:hypothetical protein
MNYDLDTEQGLANSVEWQTKMMSLLNDGGKWGIPRSGCVYTVYPSRKIAVRIRNEEEVDKVFTAMGWELREEL